MIEETERKRRHKIPLAEKVSDLRAQASRYRELARKCDDKALALLADARAEAEAQLELVNKHLPEEASTT